MTIIDAETVSVTNTDELRDAVSTDNGITTVYLENDIVLAYGIVIYPGKATLVIDGLYPLDGTGVIHRFTDMNSIFQTDTIGIRSQSDINLTFRNMIIAGRNYFGVPSIYEGSQFNGVTVSYENVTYTGPQMAYNPDGLTRFKDCDITISYPADPNRMQEVGEVCRVEMEGKVNIQHNDTNDAVFWFRGDTGATAAYFHVLNGADVTINTNSYFMYASKYIFPSWQPRPAAFVIEDNASLKINSNRGFSLDSGHQAASFLAGENAVFRYTQAAANGTNSSLYLNGAFMVNKGANVYMGTDFTNNASIIHFATNSASLTVNDPKSFVLYARGISALTFAAQIPYSFAGGQLNYWFTPLLPPTAGTFDDIPQSKWYKDNYATFTWDGTMSLSGTTIGNTNFTATELGRNPPLTYLRLQDARVLSIGDPTLEVNPIVDNAAIPITGNCDAGANIRVKYDTNEINLPNNPTDSFSVSKTETIPAGTLVTVSANIPFLIIDVEKISQLAGELGLVSAPALITFLLTPVSTTPVLLLARDIPDMKVVVRDTRAFSTDWLLMAKIDGPLETASGHTEEVVFVDDVGITPLSQVLIPVYSGTASDGSPKDTECQWNADRGILLHVTQPIFNSERYTARMTWEVQPITFLLNNLEDSNGHN